LDQLEGRPLDKFFGLELKCLPQKNLKCPTVAALEAMLYLDFCFDVIDTSEKGMGVLRIAGESVAKWVRVNGLD
jgi:hypothetical protein